MKEDEESLRIRKWSLIKEVRFLAFIRTLIKMKKRY